MFKRHMESKPQNNSRSLQQNVAKLFAFVPIFFVSFLFLSALSAQDDKKENPKFTDAQLEHFETKIRPLLAKRCYECHGPDVEEPGGGLRFSSRKALLIGGDTGAAIKPGDAKESLLVDSINYGDVYEMPPDSKLPADEIKLLTDWVADQAPWPHVEDKHLADRKSFNIEELKKQHWCWTPPQPTAPPTVKNKDWPLDPLDQFILKKNEELGLEMAKPAARRIWLRRVYFDLIGLPPSPQQIEAFANDKNPNAFEKVVDELLASEHFGERWARHWMDLIRYAETCGHEFEYPIPHAYRYRDYLIRAFNEDVPYHLFVKEHIAGDLLDKPRRNPEQQYNESILGTGFWFLHEATHAPVDVRLDEANHNDNRVDVMSKTFLGLTVACARCHDHKFDAISTKDYYSLIGFLQSSHRQLAMLDPHRKIETGTNKIRQIRNSISQQIREQIRKQRTDADSLGKQFLQQFKPANAESKQAKESERPKVTTDFAQILKTASTDPYHPLWLWQQVTHEGKGFDRNRLLAFEKKIADEKSFRVWDATKKEQKLPLLFTDFDQPNFGDWSTTGTAFGTQPTQAGHWNRLSEDGFYFPSGYADSSQFSLKHQGVLRSPTFELQSNDIWYRIKGKGVKLRLIIDGYVMDVYNGLLFSGATINLDTKDQFQWVRQSGDIRRYQGERAHIEIIDQGGGYAIVDKIVFSNSRPPEVISEATRTIFEVVKVAKNQVDFANLYAKAIEKHQIAIPGFNKDGLAEAAKKAQEMIGAIEKEIPSPILAPAITDGSPEDEYVFIRGNHKSLGEAVPRRTLEALGGQGPISGSQTGSGRLALANQIASADNPLTSRVMVNRIWHHLFGRGIVASTNNFGVLGQDPTHPQLLDYLATEFVEEGWSIKKMIKRMVLSQTYRMSSELNPKAKEVDPQNLYLHRMSIRRLQAEAIRDSMLTISGRLDPTVYGPSVPVHLTPFMQGRGRPGRNGPLDGNGRRSLYTEIRRNFLPPMMLAFDMPIPFNSIGRRNLSNVPAQALILMNDPLVIGQADVWAKKLIKEVPEIEKRIDRMYMQAFSRLPTDVERSRANHFIQNQAKELGVKPDAIGASQEIWRDLAHVLFNVKEFIYLK